MQTKHNDQLYSHTLQDQWDMPNFATWFILVPTSASLLPKDLIWDVVKKTENYFTMRISLTLTISLTSSTA